MSYWWCVQHAEVESGDDSCAAVNRLGPYETRAAAAAAPASTRARTAEQDARDKADDDWGR